MSYNNSKNMSKQRLKMVKSINSLVTNNSADNNKQEFCDALNWCIDCLKSNNYYASNIHSDTTISWRSYEIGKEIFRSIIEIIKKHNLIDIINDNDVFNYANVCIPSSVSRNNNTDVVIDADQNIIISHDNNKNNQSIQPEKKYSSLDGNYTGEIERLETDFSDNESCYNDSNNKINKKNNDKLSVSEKSIVEIKKIDTAVEKEIENSILIDAKIDDAAPGTVDKDDIEEFEPENLVDEEEDMEVDTDESDLEDKLGSVVEVDKVVPVVDASPVGSEAGKTSEKTEERAVDEAVPVEQEGGLKKTGQKKDKKTVEAPSEDGIEEFDPVNFTDASCDEEETENEMEREIPVLSNKLLINKTIKINKALLEKAKCLEPIKDPFVRPILLSKFNKPGGKIFNHKSKIVKLKLPLFTGGKIKKIVAPSAEKCEEKKTEKEAVVVNEEYEIEKLDEEILNNESTSVSKILPGDEYEIEELDEEILSNDKTTVEKNLPSEEYEIESLDDVILNSDSTNVSNVLPTHGSKKETVNNKENKIVDKAGKNEEGILNNEKMQIEEEEEDKIQEFGEEEVLSPEGTKEDNENEQDERNKIGQFIPVISLDEDIEENLEKSIIKRFESATSDEEDVTEENSEDDEFEAEYLTHEDLNIEQDVEPDSTREDQSELLENEVLDAEDDTVQLNNLNEERIEEEEEEEEETFENLAGKKEEVTPSNPEKTIQEEGKETPGESMIVESIAEAEADKAKSLEENCNNNSNEIFQPLAQANKNEIFEFQQINSNPENIYHGENMTLGEIHIQKVGGEIGQGEKILVSLNLLLGPDETEKAKVEILECGILKNKDTVFGKDMVFVSPKMIVRIEDENTSSTTNKQTVCNTENTTKEDPTTTELAKTTEEEIQGPGKSLSLEKTETTQYNNFQGEIPINGVTMPQVPSPDDEIDKHYPQDVPRSVSQISKIESKINPVVQIEKLDFQVTKSLQTSKIDVEISTPTTPIWEKSITMDNDVPLDCTKKDKINTSRSLNNQIDPMFQQNDKIISTQSPIQQSVIDSVFENNHAFSAQDISMCPVTDLHHSTINPTSMNTVDIINDGVEESLDLQIGGQHVIQALQNGIEEQYCSSLMNGDARDEQNVYVDKEQQDQRYFPNFMQSSDVFDQIPENNSVYNHCPPVATSMTLNEDGQEQHPLGWNEEVVNNDDGEDENGQNGGRSVLLQGIPINYSQSPESELSSSMMEIQKYMDYEYEYEPPTRRRRHSNDNKQQQQQPQQQQYDELPPPAKRQRNWIPYEDKFKLIDLASKNPDWSLETLREQARCPCLSNLTQVRVWASQFENKNSEFSKRYKINEMVFEKFMGNQRTSKRITDDIVKIWAHEANKSLSKPSKLYHANDEWLYNFKKAYNITVISGQLICINEITTPDDNSQPIENEDNYNVNEDENDNLNENYNENQDEDENYNENQDENDNVNENSVVNEINDSYNEQAERELPQKIVTKAGNIRLKRINLSDEEKIRIIKMVRNNPHWTLSTLVKHSGARIKSFTQIYHWEKKLKADGKLIPENILSNVEIKDDEDQPLSTLLQIRQRQQKEKMLMKRGGKRKEEISQKPKIVVVGGGGRKRVGSDKKTVTLVVGKKRGERKMKLNSKQRGEAQMRIVGKKRNIKLRGKRKVEKGQTIIDEKNQQEEQNDIKLKGKNGEKLTIEMPFEVRRDAYEDAIYLKCVEQKRRGCKLTNTLIRRWSIENLKDLHLESSINPDRKWRKYFKKKYQITGKFSDLEVEPQQAPADDNNTTTVENFHYQEERPEEEQEEEEEENDEKQEEDEESTTVRNDYNEDEDNEEKTFDHHNLSSIAQRDDEDKYTPESLKNIMNSNDKKVKIVSVEMGPTISEAMFDPTNGIKWRVGTP